jgi:hypothetical protein
LLGHVAVNPEGLKIVAKQLAKEEILYSVAWKLLPHHSRASLIIPTNCLDDETAKKGSGTGQSEQFKHAFLSRKNILVGYIPTVPMVFQSTRLLLTWKGTMTCHFRDAFLKCCYVKWLHGDLYLKSSYCEGKPVFSSLNHWLHRYTWSNCPLGNILKGLLTAWRYLKQVIMLVLDRSCYNKGNWTKETH